ncbi:MAG: MgtC/SapB family protein [Candidatus Kapaibacterium sp.]|jgi:putative Mg2+ transporter-C (MgtC) family protein
MHNETFEGFIALTVVYGPRAVAALIAGGLIGLENQIFAKPAGLRTNVVLCLSCCVITIISIITGQTIGGEPSRITAQILTGIGFLGGGVILHYRDRVSGITTAATIFVTASVGITVGTGYIFTGVAVALLTAIILVVLRPVDALIEDSAFFKRMRKRGQREEKRKEAEDAAEDALRSQSLLGKHIGADE